MAAPRKPVPIEYPLLLLDVDDNLVHDFVVKLGVKQLSTAQALVDLVFPAIAKGLYSTEKITTCMTFVCDNFSELLSQDASFATHVASVKFVPKLNKSLVVPCELFNKHDATLQQLFDGEDVFPAGCFAKINFAPVLQRVGLKGVQSVTARDVLNIASKVNENAASGVHRANALLAFLENHGRRLLSEVLSGTTTLADRLRDMRWIPVLRQRPNWYPKTLRFYPETCSDILFSPSVVATSEHCSLIGAMRPVLDDAKFVNLATVFRWNLQPNIDEVVQQLFHVIAAFRINEKTEYQRILKSVYSYFNTNVDEFGHVAGKLTKTDWIFHSNGFTTSSRIVKQKPFIDLQPHVYIVPEELVGFSKLWTTAGVRDACSLINVLHDISRLHCNCEASSEIIDRDLSLSISILNKLATEHNRHIFRDELIIPVATSDGSLSLKPIDDCTYFDKEWFQQGRDVSDVDSMHEHHLVHPHISPDTAEALNIHSAVSRFLDAEELDVGYASYGQSEPLTCRLKSILRDYTDGIAVIKELIQNADDAGAKEVTLLYDERQNLNAQTKLIDEGMKAVHGPALWAHNDAQFSHADFDNLIKLSGATKEMCKNKIGRFGLGFNAVYNLTDVPSLVSQKYVVFLDPHTTHLNRALRDKTKPGIKLDLTRNFRFRLWSDQFQPYNGLFGCRLHHENGIKSYPGTLFRFPLRNLAGSRESKICDKFYSREEMINLLSVLGRNADQILLFTQSVRKISVMYLSDVVDGESNYDVSSHIKTMFSIDKNVDEILRPMHMTELCDNQFAFLKQVDILCCNCDESGGVFKLESSFVLRVTVKCYPSVDELEENSVTEGDSYWLVASSMGCGESLKMALSEKDLSSVGGAAALLVKNGEKMYSPLSLPEDSGGSMFCFLPLPSKCHLPVHMNGFFDVASSRTHLTACSDNDKVLRGAKWNRLLMADAVVQAYIVLLEDVARKMSQSQIYALWPLYDAAIGDVNALICIESLYGNICREQGPAVFRCEAGIASFHQCLFLEPSFRQSEAGDAAVFVMNAVLTGETWLADLPIGITLTILKTKSKNTFLKRVVSKHEFFEKWFLPKIGSISPFVRDGLILYALFDDTLRELLRNTNCIPVKPSGKLRKPTDLVDPSSPIAILFDEESERFPSLSVASSNRRHEGDIIQKLLDLGMQHDDLSWIDIVDRCTVVPSKSSLVSARLEVLMKLMSQKVLRCSAAEKEQYLDTISKIRFLPIKQKPVECPLPWKGDDETFDGFVSCHESYLPAVSQLVCCSFPIVDDKKLIFVTTFI
jgi:sacsin